jgi:hypothetical protein
MRSGGAAGTAAHGTAGQAAYGAAQQPARCAGYPARRVTTGVSRGQAARHGRRVRGQAAAASRGMAGRLVESHANMSAPTNIP